MKGKHGGASLLCLGLFCLTLVGSCRAEAKAPQNPPMQQVSLSELAQMGAAAKEALWRAANEAGRPVKLYLHWSAGHYDELFAAYHLNIDADGKIYAAGDDLAALRAHTYQRNTGAIGLSLACCFGATPRDLGKEPPTEAQIAAMADAIAVLTHVLDIPIDRTHVMTHGEAGDNADGIFPPYADNGRPYGMYGPFHGSERWDLAILKNGDPWLSGGNTLRFKALIAALRQERSRRT